MDTTVRLKFFYPYQPQFSPEIDHVQYERPTVEKASANDEWIAIYYVMVSSPEKDYEKHLDWIIENHGQKDWEDLLAQQGRIETNKQNANYNFDVYYDRVHSEVVSQAAERIDGDGDLRLDS